MLFIITITGNVDDPTWQHDGTLEIILLNLHTPAF